MKQRVEVKVTTPSTGYKIKIQSVHQVDNQLVVVTKVTAPRGLAGCTICTDSDFVVVKTDSNKQLPVVHYLTGVDKSKGDNHIGNYGRRVQLGHPYDDTTDFKPISDVSEISHILASGKCLYQPRSDGMIGLRLNRYHQAQESASQAHTSQSSSIAEKPTVFSADQLKSILNVYATVDDGTIKVVFESITQEDKTKRYKKIQEIFNSVLEKQNKRNKISVLENTFLMRTDDNIHFEAATANVKTKFSSGALEFSIPANNHTSVLHFMLLVDAVIVEAKVKSDYSDSYKLVQISQESMLSCFEDLFLSTQPDRKYGGKKHCIENIMSVAFEDFLNKPGTVHNPVSVGEKLLETIITLDNLPEYADFHEYLATYFKPFGLDVAKDPDKYIEQMLGIDLKQLYGDTSEQEKLAMTDELEHSLLNEKIYNPCKYFVGDFYERALVELIIPAIGKQAHDGGSYRYGYTEFDLLLDAKFCIRDDGRMSILLQDNAGYQRHYGKDSRNHDICEAEFRHLANVLKLEFSTDTDYHKEMIFTPESTLKLKALGLHINDTSLRQQRARLQQPVKTTVEKSFGLFAAKGSATKNDAVIKECVIVRADEDTKKIKR